MDAGIIVVREISALQTKHNKHRGLAMLVCDRVVISPVCSGTVREVAL